MPRTTRRPRYTRQTTILQQVAQIRRERSEAPRRAAQENLARVLDGLNVLGTLEELRTKRFSPNLCHGPKTVGTLEPVVCVGAVLWHRPAGYYGYKTLTIVGVWARAESALPLISVGVKRLAFARDFYDAEAYHKLIRRGFDLYYNDDGLPPSDAFTTPYSAEQRLSLREIIAAELAKRV
jgi:hypothetical protein